MQYCKCHVRVLCSPSGIHHHEWCLSHPGATRTCCNARADRQVYLLAVLMIADLMCSLVLCVSPGVGSYISRTKRKGTPWRISSGKKISFPQCICIKIRMLEYVFKRRPEVERCVQTYQVKDWRPSGRCACANLCQPRAQVCFRKGTRVLLWTLAASTHLPATDADRSGKKHDWHIRYKKFAF